MTTIFTMTLDIDAPIFPVMPGNSMSSFMQFHLTGDWPELTITSKNAGNAYWINGGVGELNLQPYADHVAVKATSINQLFADDTWHTRVTATDGITSAYIVSANGFGLSSPWLSTLTFEGQRSDIDLGALWAGSVWGDANNIEVDHLWQELIINGNCNTVDVGGDGDVFVFGESNTITSFGWDGDRFTGVIDARNAENTSVTLFSADEFGDEAVVLGGDDADIFAFYDSDVAYNPGADEDHVFVSGGRSFGNIAGDGSVDEVYFSSYEGGSHRLQADHFDQVMVDGFSAEALALITTGTTDTVALANGFNLKVDTVEWFGGIG